MLGKNIWGLAGLLLFAGGSGSLSAETLQDAVRAANVPTRQFAAAELGGKITSYAVSRNDPFLLAYYVDDGSGLLQPPLHVIRYDRKTEDLRRADLRDIPHCLGSVLAIRENHGTVYIDTHGTPSAGCLLVLSPGLAFRAALDGWLLGVLGADYAIVRRSEIHFASVHPLHIEVYDLRRNRLEEVYPYPNDPQRRQFSRSIQPHIQDQWCRKHNAQCDPEDFGVDLRGELALDEAGKVFGFEARFDAAGFGDAAEKQVPPRTVVYVFRERSGVWEHREFEPRQLQGLFGVPNLPELIGARPNAAFERAAGR